MATIYFNYCINTTSKLFACPQNRLFKLVIPLHLNSGLKRTNFGWEVAFVLFSKMPHIA